ncbi:MAG: hypothetical protein M1826_001893 [Phylliscum demangeonii]|nr:MAG: hypothetical protein M1826_001893 [Phylliscum demangeonii]
MFLRSLLVFGLAGPAVLALPLAYRFIPHDGRPQTYPYTHTRALRAPLSTGVRANPIPRLAQKESQSQSQSQSTTTTNTPSFSPFSFWPMMNNDGGNTNNNINNNNNGGWETTPTVVVEYDEVVKGACTYGYTVVCPHPGAALAQCYNRRPFTRCNSANRLPNAGRRQPQAQEPASSPVEMQILPEPGLPSPRRTAPDNNNGGGGDDSSSSTSSGERAD